MKSRERVLRALDLEEPDRVPMFELEFQYPELVCGKPYILWSGYGSWEQTVFRDILSKMKIEEDIAKVTRHNTEVLVETCSKLGYDVFRPSFVPDPLEAIRYARKIAPDLAIMGNSPGTGLGIPDGKSMFHIVKWAYTNPEGLRRIAEDRVRRSLEYIRLQVEAGAEIIVDCTDYALKSGPFFKPEFYHKVVFPLIKILVDEAHRVGAFFIQHTDGNLWPIIDGLINTGIDALHSIDPSAGMSLKEVKEKYGDRIALCGNVDAANTLFLGSPEDVAYEARNCIRNAAYGGGYFLTSSNCIYRGVPIDNTLALVKTGLKYGRYKPL
ncbi:MAG: uroporphyrinogen decarboxylase family protein [Candidatus Bathyarchaeia archaeon]